LLEVLVATAIMGIAVAGLMGNLRTSLTNASKLSDYDRAALLARRQMDELLATRPLPKMAPIAGVFPPQVTGGREAGWRALVTPFESAAPPGTPPAQGARILERIELEVWWVQGAGRRTMKLSAYRRAVATPEDAQAFQMSAGAMR
jgi:hypothetical protein